MKYKLYRKDFVVWKHDIYILPTIRVLIDEANYIDETFAIEFHFLVFHGRFLWMKGGA